MASYEAKSIPDRCADGIFPSSQGFLNGQLSNCADLLNRYLHFSFLKTGGDVCYERSHVLWQQKQDRVQAAKPASDLHVRADDDLDARPGTFITLSTVCSVAQLSENALTAVSLAFLAQNLMIAFATGTGASVSTPSRKPWEKNFGIPPTRSRITLCFLLH